jgi:acetyltransferase-like isoleucine patch superfamily enzyme
MNRRVKKYVSSTLTLLLRRFVGAQEMWERVHNHARLALRIVTPLSESVVVLGRVNVYGTRAVRFGKDALIYPNLHLETQEQGSIEIGDGVVLSTGVHLVSMAKITIGPGTMIGEYSSIRDANHDRLPDRMIREAGYTTSPIVIGSEVWIGRGVTVLEGVTIGDGATIGANAVVTHDVPPGATVAGVPARPIRTISGTEMFSRLSAQIDEGNS